VTQWDAKPSHPCPCCDFITLRSQGTYEICPVCDWEDEGFHPESARDLDAATGPNQGTLRACRLAFAETVATHGIPEPAMRYARVVRTMGS